MGQKKRTAPIAIAASNQNWWEAKWTSALGLGLLVLLAYARAPTLGFIWDDDFYIIYNATLRSWNGLWRIWTEFGATPQYYPLVHTSFWVEYHLWGLNPIGYHLLNVIFHGAAVILLWRILVRLNVPAAWFCAALFAVHPVQVESVAWVTERKNVLSGLFYFAAALLYLRWLWPSGSPSEERNSNRRHILYWMSLGIFVLALLSKTVACSLPAALLIVQWWKVGRLRGRDFLRLLPFFILGVVFGLITAWMERHHVHAEGGAWTLSIADRFLIAGRALWFYAAKLLWPAKLTFMYPQWQVHASPLLLWIFPLLAAAVVISLWLTRNRIGRGPLAAVLFFAGTLAPALGFFDIFPFRYSFVADHFQYLACAGLLIVAGVALRKLPVAALTGILILLTFLTWRQTAIYRDLETLWRDTIRKNPESWMAHNNLAMILFSQGRAEETMSHLQEASRLKPDEFEIESNLGWVLLESGRADEAFPHLRKAVASGAVNAQVHYYLGTAYYRKGMMEEATGELNDALAVEPRYVPARSELGAILLQQGRAQEALAMLEKAVAQDPEFPSARFNLANTLIQLGRRGEALEQLNAALASHPDNPEAEKNLAWVLATSPEEKMRDGGRAVELAEDARRKTGGRDPIVLITLSAAYAEAGRFSDATKTAEEASQVAAAMGKTTLAEGIRGYITLYQYGQPFRDSR